MKRLRLNWFTASVLALGILPFAGCDNKDEKTSSGPREDSPAAQTPAPAHAPKIAPLTPTPASPAATSTPAAPAATPAPAHAASAESNSFDAVAAHLDAGGALYLYLSTEQWLGTLSTQVTTWRDILQAAVAPKDNPDSKEMGQMLDAATDLIKKSGLEDVTGFGASSFAIERGVYRNKVFVHHYPGKGNGFLWSMLGKAPHPLTTLNLLPADTAVAGFADIDLAQLINVLEEEVKASGNAEAKQAMDQVLLQFTAGFGMTLDELLQSLGGGAGLVITLDPTKTI
jgi:hypothetical protein